MDEPVPLEQTRPGQPAGPGAQTPGAAEEHRRKRKRRTRKEKRE
nr:MAG TPA: hypothetical protein [Caudoviricetes sp.]